MIYIWHGIQFLCILFCVTHAVVVCMGHRMHEPESPLGKKIWRGFFYIAIVVISLIITEEIIKHTGYLGLLWLTK